MDSVYSHLCKLPWKQTTSRRKRDTATSSGGHERRRRKSSWWVPETMMTEWRQTQADVSSHTRLTIAAADALSLQTGDIYWNSGNYTSCSSCKACSGTVCDNGCNEGIKLFTEEATITLPWWLLLRPVTICSGLQWQLSLYKKWNIFLMFIVFFLISKRKNLNLKLNLKYLSIHLYFLPLLLLQVSEYQNFYQIDELIVAALLKLRWGNFGLFNERTQ